MSTGLKGATLVPDADFFRPLMIAVTFSPILLLKKLDLTAAKSHSKEGLYKFGEVRIFSFLQNPW